MFRSTWMFLLPFSILVLSASCRTAGGPSRGQYVSPDMLHPAVPVSSSQTSSPPRTANGVVAVAYETANQEQLGPPRPVPKEKKDGTAPNNPPDNQNHKGKEEGLDKEKNSSQAKNNASGDLAPPKQPPAIQGTRPDRNPNPLTLEEVVESVEKHYPLLRAAEQERTITGGRLLSAMGAFDTNVRLNNYNIPEGTFESYRFSSSIEQAFPHSGVTAFGGYRGGYGDFPVYSGGLKTAEGGEIRGGVNIPLLRDNSIDRRRANLQQAQLNREIAEPLINRQRLDFQRAASRVYWAWVASGHRLTLAKKLMELAQERDKQLKQLIQDKLVAKIDRVDNQQNLAARNGVLVEAQMRFQQASIDLSLFLRDNSGAPLAVEMDRLPEFPRILAPDTSQVEAALAVAFEQRPELKRLRLQRDNLEVEMQWVQNQRLPALNAILAGAQDFGFTKTTTGPSRLDRRSLEVGLEMQLPIQFRDASGRMETLMGQLRQVALQEAFTKDSIRAEVQSAFVNVERAHELYQQVSQRVELARRVADAERERFRDGDSDILRVTLRELAAFDAEIAVISALFEYHRSVADYRASVGIDVSAALNAPPANPPVK